MSSKNRSEIGEKEAFGVRERQLARRITTKRKMEDGRRKTEDGREDIAIVTLLYNNGPHIEPQCSPSFLEMINKFISFLPSFALLLFVFFL